MTERKCACNKLFSILVRGPTQRISKRNSTGNASWGEGPNTEADEKSAYNNVQVGDGAQQREIGFPISTDNASWGGTTK
ncbi:hypothetical protein [Staphylococcus aureus]|uniref:hypothetical protein n=1 Tax=Staphylococcus aureus TaxID=1280 RepID=UPI00161647DB|nr:hypothetical protein [Staphylococcus aureus]